MGVKRPRSRFHDRKSLPCKGRWRDSAGGVGVGHDVRPCVVVITRFVCKQSLSLATAHAPARFTHGGLTPTPCMASFRPAAPPPRARVSLIGGPSSPTRPPTVKLTAPRDIANCRRHNPQKCAIGRHFTNGGQRMPTEANGGQRRITDANGG